MQYLHLTILLHCVPTAYDSVIIGSGGLSRTIISLAITKMYKEKNEKRKYASGTTPMVDQHEIPNSNKSLENVSG